MTAHIFAGGEMRSMDFIRIGTGDLIICADSGYKYARQLRVNPDIIVGDFDSYSGELPENARIFRSVPEKDDTDTLLAVKTAIESGAEKIRIYGALGGRFDHAIANVQTLKYAWEHGCEASLEDESNTVTLQGAGERRYKRRDDRYFSVFSYSGELQIKRLSGVKYTLKDAVISNSFPIGVSNEFVDDEAVLEILRGTALVISSSK
ncbi:MAG: thiamine diphosphokinase [Ruminococcus sp.]|nr:thiamine diphosphokinase [Ruminococcus sp.]